MKKKKGMDQKSVRTSARLNVGTFKTPDEPPTPTIFVKD
jgi:hypothetical protein